MDEHLLKESFKSLKKDIEGIKEELRLIRKQQPAQPKKLRKTDSDEDGSIYTAKVFVNDAMRNSVSEVFDSGIFTGGKKVREFEKAFARFTGTTHAIACSNGTTAIELVLRGLGITKGDEIIVPSHTTMPTIEPILLVGAKPVFVDINPKTYSVDPKKIEQKITKKTKAILPVHLYGHPAALDLITSICKKHNILLIEDCAQAHGALYKGKPVGSFGIAGCFSFYPSKNMTVCGEGGMITTNNDELAQAIRRLLNHGEDGRYNHVVVGHNYRLSEIHAAIGIEQLKLLRSFVRKRREIAEEYNKALRREKIILPHEMNAAVHSYHLYVIRVPAKKRDAIIEAMRNEGVHCGIHYPTPCHKQKAVQQKVSLPITEKITSEIISLPMYPMLTPEQIKRISKALKNALRVV